MYSAVSGLRAHQIMMDVVGNNIANVNTQGYKRNQVIFQDVLSQIVAGASTPTDAVGGRNPAQVGLGVMMSGTAQQFGQGFLQVTNRALDVAIQGDGFFITDEAGEQCSPGPVPSSWTPTADWSPAAVAWSKVGAPSWTAPSTPP